jgi:hypothetical protein
MSLSTNKFMEDLIKGLTCDREDTSRDGKSVRRTYTIIDVNAMINTAGVEFSQQMNGATGFLYANMRGVDVHLRDGLQVIDGEISGKIVIKIRTWEPSNGNGWRNYQMYVNCFPSKEDPTCQIVIHDPAAPRAHRDIAGDNGMFAHVSSDNKRNHCLQVVPLNAEIDTPDRRPRRPKTDRHATA